MSSSFSVRTVLSAIILVGGIVCVLYLPSACWMIFMRSYDAGVFFINGILNLHLVPLISLCLLFIFNYRDVIKLIFRLFIYKINLPCIAKMGKNKKTVVSKSKHIILF